MIDTMELEKLALYLVILFDGLFDKKLLPYIDQVLRLNINFIKLVSQYKLFKEAVIVGESISV